MPAVPPTALVVRLRNFVGDVVLSVPTLQRLSDAGLALHLVGKGWAGPLLAGFGWPVHRLAADLPGRISQWRSLRRDLQDSGACLLQRGPGEYLGSRQSGAPLLRFADLERDADLIELARGVADNMIAERSHTVERHLDRWLGHRQFYLKA